MPRDSLQPAALSMKQVHSAEAHFHRVFNQSLSPHPPAAACPLPRLRRRRRRPPPAAAIPVFASAIPARLRGAATASKQTHQWNMPDPGSLADVVNPAHHMAHACSAAPLTPPPPLPPLSPAGSQPHSTGLSMHDSAHSSSTTLLHCNTAAHCLITPRRLGRANGQGYSSVR